MLHMNVGRSLSLFFLMAVASLSFGQNRQIQFEKGTWAEAIEKAKSEQKPIFLDAYAVWCGPCKWMSANVFTNDSVADFYNANFINVKMDMEKGEGIDLAKKLAVRAFPTLFYFESNGELMHQVCGAFESQMFIDLGKTALDPAKQLKYYQVQYEKGNRGPDFVQEYLHALGTACIKSSDVLNNFLDSQNKEDLLLPENWLLIEQMLEDYHSNAFQYLESNSMKFSELYGAENVNDKIKSVYELYLGASLSAKDLADFDKRKEELKNKNNAMANQVILDQMIFKYAYMKDWKNYVATVDEYIAKYDSSNWMNMNAYAWHAYEKITDKKLLKKAIVWIEKSVSISENTYNLDTYAHLLAAVGRTKEAIKAQEKVVKIATEEGSDEVSTFQEYLDLLKSK